jgi:hypothetical protein
VRATILNFLLRLPDTFACDAGRWRLESGDGDALVTVRLSGSCWCARCVRSRRRTAMTPVRSTRCGGISTSPGGCAGCRCGAARLYVAISSMILIRSLASSPGMERKGE